MNLPSAAMVIQSAKERLAATFAGHGVGANRFQVATERKGQGWPDVRPGPEMAGDVDHRHQRRQSRQAPIEHRRRADQENETEDRGRFDERVAPRGLPQGADEGCRFEPSQERHQGGIGAPCQTAGGGGHARPLPLRAIAAQARATIV